MESFRPAADMMKEGEMRLMWFRLVEENLRVYPKYHFRLILNADQAVLIPSSSQIVKVHWKNGLLVLHDLHVKMN